MSNKEIHKFALKWFDKFRDTKATGRDLCEDTAFADECFALLLLIFFMENSE